MKNNYLEIVKKIDIWQEIYNAWQDFVRFMEKLAKNGVGKTGKEIIKY